MSSVENLKERARSFEQNEQWGEALDLYSQAIDLLSNDDTPDIALFNRSGDLATRIGSAAQAVAFYERAVDFYMDAGLPNNAVAVCKKVMRNLPDRYSIHLKMGQIRAAQGFITDARSSFVTYAENVQAAGDLDEALRALIEFVNLAPDDYEICMILGAQLEQSNRTSDALTQYVGAYRIMRRQGLGDLAQNVAARIRRMDPSLDLEQAASDESFNQGAGSEDSEGGVPVPDRETEIIGPVDLPLMSFDDDDADAAPNKAAEEAAAKSAEEAKAKAAEEAAAKSAEEAEAKAAKEAAAKAAGEAAARVASAVAEETAEKAAEEAAAKAAEEAAAKAAEEAAAKAAEEAAAKAAKEAAAKAAEQDAAKAAAKAEEQAAAKAEEQAAAKAAQKARASAAEEARASAAEEARASAAEEARARAAEEAAAARAAEEAAAARAAAEAAAARAAADADTATTSVEESLGVSNVDPEPESATAASSEPYVDIGAMLLGDEVHTTQKSTRFVVPYEEPTGDDQADFEKMLDQFKKKVTENIETSDVTAHYDLGTAYMEMGLLDEAIGEFQMVLRSTSDHLATYEMLGQTFLQKQEPEAALQSLTRGLDASGAIEEERVGIYYYLGLAHETIGNTEKAAEFYDKVFAIDINFADVTERLRGLRT